MDLSEALGVCGETRAEAAGRAESGCGGLCAPLSCGPQGAGGKAGARNEQCGGLIGSKGMQKRKQIPKPMNTATSEHWTVHMCDFT